MYSFWTHGPPKMHLDLYNSRPAACWGDMWNRHFVRAYLSAYSNSRSVELALAQRHGSQSEGCTWRKHLHCETKSSDCSLCYCRPSLRRLRSAHVDCLHWPVMLSDSSQDADNMAATRSPDSRRFSSENNTLTQARRHVASTLF